jgi:RNA polymerase-binding protein DksA
VPVEVGSTRASNIRVTENVSLDHYHRKYFMPDYSALRAQLQEQLKQLIARAEKIDDDLSVPGDEDWEERATEAEGDEVLASVGNLALKEISQIKHALFQIEEGTYGVCEKCGVEIPQARLEAIPYATRCTGCA